MSACRGFDFWQSTERLHCTGATPLLLFRTTCPFVVKTNTLFLRFLGGGGGGRGGLFNSSSFKSPIFTLCMKCHDNKFLCHCRKHESEIVSSGVVSSLLFLFLLSRYCMHLHFIKQSGYPKLFELNYLNFEVALVL